MAVFGLVMAVRNGSWGKGATEFHEKLSKRLPWPYWGIPGAMPRSEGFTSVLYLFVGLAFLVVGVLTAAGVIRN